MSRGGKRDVEQRDQGVHLAIGDNTWLDLGQLRALVRRADELGLADTSLISHTHGSEHLTRHDVRIARRIVIEADRPVPS